MKKNASSTSVNNLSNKKKKKKTAAATAPAKQTNSNQTNQVVEPVSSQLEEAIDPDEETYCLCGKLLN